MTCLDRLALLLAAGAVLALVSGSEAMAQGRMPLSYAPAQPTPFDFIGRLFGARPRPLYEPPAAAPQAVPSGRSTMPRAEATGVAIAYCVRTCDGRYFPLQGRPSGAGDSNAIAQCEAFCPAAKMQVYTSPDQAKGIDAASDRNGRPYSALPNAFVYRTRLVDGCSCTGKAQVGGLAPIDVVRDPTLKRGDMVMTPSGIRVFASEKARPPYRANAFVSPSRFPELPRDMRQRIERLSVASM